MSDADCTPGREPRSVAASVHCACTASAILTIIYWAGLLLPGIIMILFTQSTVVVLHKYLIVLELFVIIFPDVAHYSLRIPGVVRLREFPE